MKTITINPRKEHETGNDKFQYIQDIQVNSLNGAFAATPDVQAIPHYSHSVRQLIKQF